VRFLLTTANDIFPFLSTVESPEREIFNDTGSLLLYKRLSASIFMFTGALFWIYTSLSASGVSSSVERVNIILQFLQADRLSR
jgi:hypothetical protein